MGLVWGAQGSWGHLPSSSRELGRREREALQQMAEVAREGFRLKQVLIEEATKGREEKQVRDWVGLLDAWVLFPAPC